jgi:hypothetical protein
MVNARESVMDPAASAVSSSGRSFFDFTDRAGGAGGRGFDGGWRGSKRVSVHDA